MYGENDLMDKVSVPIRWLTMLLLAVPVSFYVVWSLRWPLIGDASLMHYVAFLMDHGRAPYREIFDINFPGAYLPDWLVMHTLGPGDLAWRVYDLLASCVIALAMFSIAGRRNIFAVAWASMIFVLIHGRDGLEQSGQRDFTVAMLLMVGVAALLRGVGRRTMWMVALFGACIGAAAMIKPTAYLLLLLVFVGQRGSEKIAWRSVVTAFGASLLPVAITLLWLLRHHALAAFLSAMQDLASYHGLGRRPIRFLLQHSFSPILELVGVWLLLVIARKIWARGFSEEALPVERRVLSVAAILCLITYVVQGKGYPYHRYSLLVFVLLAIALDLSAMLKEARVWRMTALGVFLASSILIGPISAMLIGRYEWRAPGIDESVAEDLRELSKELGESDLSNHVQCLDMVSGCVNALYDLRVVQSTRFVSDEFLFHAADMPPVSRARKEFLKEVQDDPPQIFVVTDFLFPDGPGEYGKLKNWPQFTDWLEQRYSLVFQRPERAAVRIGGPKKIPAGYRIYVERSVAGNVLDGP